MSVCNGSDTGLNVTRSESEQTSIWCFLAREYGESLEMEKQMTEQSADASIRAYSHWNQIPWEAVEQSVRRLQTRIAKAVMEKKHRKVSALQ